MSRRCLLFDHVGSVVEADQKEHRQIYPVVRRVEHDPDEIRACTPAVVERARMAAGIAVGSRLRRG